MWNEWILTVFLLTIIKIHAVNKIGLNKIGQTRKDWSNSIWVEGFSKLSQISAFLNIHQFDIFCLTETFLDSSISSEDPRLAIEGYKLFRCDHPSNLRKGGVCLYFKDHLPLALRPDLTTLDEFLVCEIQNGFKRFF